jgi:hypothetical protein
VVRAALLVVGDREQACELAQEAFVQLPASADGTWRPTLLVPVPELGGALFVGRPVDGGLQAVPAGSDPDAAGTTCP